jgi:dTDP-4-amino-4,6-dideoxygalactose transaminase
MPRIHLSPPDVGPLEREFLLRAFDSGWVAPAGPELDAFERDLAAFTGWPAAVALSSGTAALHLALLVSGVGPGDDVLVSTFTFAASANAVVHCGANPVFVDSEWSSWNMDPALLADALSAGAADGRPPKAAVVVDLYGQCADYDAIAAPCRDHGVTVVEDAAEALGATHGGSAAGTLGDIGVFSFNGNKVATTSGGGAVVTPDATVADRVRHLANQAREPAAHFEHAEVGYNYRLSNLLAAVGRAQLTRLPELVERRLAIHDRYRKSLGDLPGVELMPIAPWGRWNGWLTCIVLDDEEQRDVVIARLAAEDIESRPLWKPMHLQPVFRDRRSWTTGVSEDLFRRGVCLPSGSRLTDDQVDTVAALVGEAIAS